MTTIKTPSTKIDNTLNGPKTPRWWQTYRSLVEPMPYLEELRSLYGELYQGQFLSFPPFAVLAHPKAIEQVFTANPDNFDTSSNNFTLQPIIGDFSVIMLDGAAHQRQRKLLMPPFHGERMRTYGETISTVTERVIGQWQKNQPFSMRTATQEITLRVILRAVFGIDEGERLERLRQLLGEWLNVFNSSVRSSLLFFKGLQQDLGPWSPWGRFVRRRQQIDEIIYAEIRERQNQPLGEDILSLMLAARDENGQPMTELELRDELMALLFAGHETTASALAWAFYWLHRDQKILHNLLDELSSVNSDTDASTIAKLPYLSAVCSETLRIYPVVLFTFARLLKVPMQIMEYDIAPGTILAPCIYLVHHREDLYPNSKQFRPERFLERQFSPYEYFPFGGSNRRCLGYAFALFEMKLVLATVLQQVKLTLLDKSPIYPIRRGVTFTPSTGVKMMVTD